MARTEFPSKTPLIGMLMIFAALAIVAFTAYQHAGLLSIIGYAVAAVVGVWGFALTFRDLSDPPPPRQGPPPSGADPERTS
ncbi:hypothetical protein FOS14_14015 [Skermania sp. ID1734]|uniref:hypothetical protein n=1 Tax=Skermania sp. ID1734 TaxID=2597516 RepID=UPI00117F7B28|nr:hypothetical protein [Skermania sp. ID1734]TSD98102.1 hypothetical protein FOS14_14015 [Skermania sp. ID1734]